MAEKRELDLTMFPSETRVVWRSEIHLSTYNPRTISKDGKKQLKRSLKNFGVIGGIVVNVQTGNTIVSGHQKVALLDEKYGYSEANPGENDYQLKAEFIDVDEKTEKEMNIMFNNPNVGGSWDMDALAKLVPDIDYKRAGLEEADLSLIGLDFLYQTEGENQIANALDDMMAPVEQKRAAERDARKAQRQAEKEAAKAKAAEQQDEEPDEEEQDPEADRAAKVAHMKDVKQQVRKAAQEKAENMDAYVMISFDTRARLAAFLDRFGFPQDIRFIKGEVFDEMIERID
jgi:hypothetical protein